MSPLSAADLADIRRQTILTQLALARRYGVTPQTIEAIVKGRPWQRLAEDRLADLPLNLE
jgi:DNA-binding XRE family transcriptional regulator